MSTVDVKDTWVDAEKSPKRPPASAPSKKPRRQGSFKANRLEVECLEVRSLDAKALDVSRRRKGGVRATAWTPVLEAHDERTERWRIETGDFGLGTMNIFTRRLRRAALRPVVATPIVDAISAISRPQPFAIGQYPDIHSEHFRCMGSKGAEPIACPLESVIWHALFACAFENPRRSISLPHPWSPMPLVDEERQWKHCGRFC